MTSRSRQAAYLMVVTVCVMVPVLVIVSEVLNKTRDIAGKAMPGRQRIIMDVFIGALLLAEIVTTCLLLWMLFHGTPFYMWPALVVVGSLVHIGITLERQLHLSLNFVFISLCRAGLPAPGP